MNILNLPPLLAQIDPYAVPELTDAEAATFIGMLIAAALAMAVPLLILGAIYVVANWKIFEKAGQPGWAALIPIYNIIVMLDVQGRPKWWIIWYLIPFVNYVSGVVMFIVQCLDYAKRFGKDGGFVAGLILLNPIFLLILAFGSAQYQGVSAAAAPPADPPAAPPADPPAEEA
ncbi:MAG: DUF5684 domain-containing protein [Roseibacillus sp.]|nr:DUF5684 domain-containing protein [Roseibacillus sp.]